MYLGIDLGTSSVKVVLINEEQKIIAQASQSLTVSRPQPLWSEQNPQDWWGATCAAMQELRQTHSNELAAVKAIGLSGQQHGAVLLDKNNQVLRPAILWNDGRSLAQCQQLEQQVSECTQIIGNRLMPGFTAPKLLWVLQNEPEIFQQVAKVLLPKDYLRLQITDEYASDLSDASGTGWLNVGARKWSEQMLHATHLTEQHMPKLFEGSEVTGTVTAAIAQLWGIPKNTLVVGGAGDNAASAISVNVIKNGSAFLSLGTSGVYFVSNDSFKANPQDYVHTFCHCLPKLWHQMSVHLSAASCVTWLANILKQDSQELVTAAENAAPSQEKIIFLPYLSGERTPHNNPYARGVFFGLSHETQATDLTHAVLEGVAFAFADGQDAILAAGTQIDDVTVVGGGAQSLYWGKILAAVLNRRLIYRKNREIGAALGAARLAWLAVHKVDPQNAFPTPPIETVIEPEKNLVELYQERRALFKQLYQQLKGC